MRSSVRSWKSLLGKLGLKITERPKHVSRSRLQQRQLAVESLESRDLMATLYWDTNGSAPGLGGAGTWNTSAANWTTDPSGSSATQAWNNAAGDIAVFKGTGASVTIGSGIQVSALKIESNGYTLGSGSMAVNGTGEIEVASGISTTISTQLTGSTDLSKTGTGTLTWSGQNTLSGNVTVVAGTLNAATGNNSTNPTQGSLGNGQATRDIIVESGATLKFTGSDMFGNGSSTPVARLVVNGGTVTNNGGQFTTLGDVVLNGGTLTGTGGASSNYNLYRLNGAVTVTANSTISGTGTNAGIHLSSSSTTFDVASGVTLNVSAKLLNQAPLSTVVATSLTKSGSGTLILTADNTYSGGTIINAGTLQVGNAGTTGTFGTGSVSNSGSLVFNRSNSLSVSSVLSGTGSVTQSGSGTTTLSGNNAFTGNVTVAAGALNAATGNNSVNPTQGSLGNAQATRDIIVESGATLRFTGNDMFGNGGSTPVTRLVINGGTVTNNGAQITTLGPVVLNGGTLTSTGGFNTNYASYTLAGSITVTANSTISGTGTNAGVHLSPSTTTIDVASGVTLDVSTKLVNKGPLSAPTAASFRKTGSGTLTLSADNTYTGGTTIDAGTLQVGNGGTAGSVGTGPVSNAASLIFNRNNSLTVSGVLSGAGTVTQAGTGTTTLSGNNTFTGNLTVAAGTLSAATGNNVVNSTAGSLGNGQATRDIIVESGATLKFSGSDLFGNGGSTPVTRLVVNGGTVTNNGGQFNTLGSVVLNGGNLTGTGGANANYNLYRLNGTITVSANSTISGTGTNSGIHLSSSSTTFDVASGVTLNVSAKLLNQAPLSTVTPTSLRKTGSGTLVITGDNTYSGGTTIETGTLQVGNGGTSGSVGSGAIDIQSSFVFNRSDIATLANQIIGTGTLSQNGPGTLIVSGTPKKFAGTSIVNAGTFQVDALMFNPVTVIAGVLQGVGAVGPVDNQGGIAEEKYYLVTILDVSKKFTKASAGYTTTGEIDYVEPGNNPLLVKAISPKAAVFKAIKGEITVNNTGVIYDITSGAFEWTSDFVVDGTHHGPAIVMEDRFERPDDDRDYNDQFVRVKAELVTIDIDVDSDNDGTIEPNDNDEDSIEENNPGKIVPWNNDDDDQNGVTDFRQETAVQGENDLVEVLISNSFGSSHALQNAQLKLSSADTNMRVYLNSNKTGLLDLAAGKLWKLDGTEAVPEKVYVEGIEFGKVTLKLELLDDGYDVISSDKVVLRVIGADIDVDSNNNEVIDPDNTKDGTDDPIENDEDKPGKRIDFSTANVVAPLTKVELRGIDLSGLSTSGMSLTLTASAHIKVWSNSAKETLICDAGQSVSLTLNGSFDATTYYVEGLSAGEATLTYTLSGGPLSNAVSDTVKYTVNDSISLEVVDQEADELSDTASFRIKRTSTGDAEIVRFRVLPQSTATSAYGSTLSTFDAVLSALFGSTLEGYQSKDYDLESSGNTLQHVSTTTDGIDFDITIPTGESSVLVAIKGVADTLTELFREVVIVKLIERPNSESGSSEAGKKYTIETPLPEALDIKDSGSSIKRTTSHAAMLHDLDPVENYFGIFVDGWVRALYDPVNKPWLNPTVAQAPAHGYAQVLPNGSFSYYPNVSKVGNELKLNEGVPYVGDDTFTVSVNVNDHLEVARARLSAGLGLSPGGTIGTGVETLFVQYLFSLHPKLNPLLTGISLSGALTELQSQSSDARNQVSQSVSIKVTNDAPEAFDDKYPVINNPNNPPENGSSGSGSTESQSYFAHDRPVFISSDQGVLANDKDEYRVRDNGKDFSDPEAKLPEDRLKASLVTVTEEAANGRGQKGPTTQGGTVELFENGSFIYTPKAGFTGEDTFDYTVSDGITSSSSGGSGGSGGSGESGEGEAGEGESGGSSGSGSGSSKNRATVTLVVGNTAPKPISREYTIVHDSGTLFISEEDSILGADIAKNKRADDYDGDHLKVKDFEPPAQGTFTLKDNGAFAYKPQAGFVGTVTIPVTVTDGVDDGYAQITITVTNQTPVVKGEGNEDYPYTPGYSTWHSTALHITANEGVLANDFDPDLDQIWISEYTLPQHGDLTLNKDGSFSFIPEDGKVEDVTFTYKVTDGLSTSESFTAKIQVRNEKPVGKDDYYEAETDGVLSVLRWDGVIKNDSDANGDYLEAELIDGPTNGTLEFRASGGFVYTPNPGFEGHDSFTYKLRELSPGGNPVLAAGESSSDPATAITANIYVVNKSNQNAPDVQDDNYETSHTQPLVVSAGGGLLANDSDQDDDPLFATLVSGPSKGTVVINSDGSFLYTPTALANPGPGLAGVDSFTYSVSDGHGNSTTATATINILNTAPIARDIRYEVDHGGAIARLASDGVLSRAFDADGDNLIASIPLTSEELRAQIHGELILDSSGSFFYRPDAGFSGTVSVPFLAYDRLSNSAPATLTITVLNAAPKASDDQFKIVHNAAQNRWYKSGQGVSLAPVSMDRLNDQKLVLQRAEGLLKNDTDRDQDQLTVHLVTASLPDPNVVGTLVVDPDGSLVYTPKIGYQGTFSFTYFVNDGYVDSENATVTIEVTDQAPVAQADAYQVAHNTSLITSVKQGVLANDWDADTDLLQVELVDDVTSGILYLDAKGWFVYTPDASFVGQTSFTYRSTDGLYYSETTTVSLIVAADAEMDGLGSAILSGRAPTGAADTYSVNHDTVLTIHAGSQGLLDNDGVDQDGVLVALPVVNMGPAHGVLQLAADGSFRYTPTAGYVGSDSFSYMPHDGLQGGAPVTVTINVTNSAPTNDGKFSFEVHAGKELKVTWLQGAVAGAVDTENDTVTARLADPNTPLAHGGVTLNADGSFIYVPDAGFVGDAEFDVELVDTHGAVSSSISIKLKVTNNLPKIDERLLETVGTPQGNVRKLSTTHDQKLVIPGSAGLLASFQDEDGDHLRVVLDLDPENTPAGTLYVYDNGGFIYTPPANSALVDSFTYRVSDDRQLDENGNYVLSDPIKVVIDVRNSVPSVLPTQYRSVSHNGHLLVPANAGVLPGMTDEDGDLLSVQLISGPTSGTLSLDPSGAYFYDPNDAFYGQVSFTYQVSDGMSAVQGAVIIDVTNMVPTAKDLGGSEGLVVLHDTALAVYANEGLLDGLSDDEGDPLTISIVTNVAHGNLKFKQDGSFYYEPVAGYSGSDSFTYKISDGLKESQATVTFKVEEHLPEGVDDEYTVYAGDTLYVGSNLPSDRITGALGDSNGIWHGAFDANSLLANDTDADNTQDEIRDPLRLKLLTEPMHAQQFDINQFGYFIYTPNTDFPNGNADGVDTFTYQLVVVHRNGQEEAVGEPVTVTINVKLPALEVTNDGTEAPNSFVYKVEQGETLIVKERARGVLGNDAVGKYATTKAELVGSSEGLQLAADGTFTFVANEIGTKTFTYLAKAKLNLPGASENAETVQQGSITIVVVESKNKEPQRANFANTPEGQRLYDIEKANYEFNKASRAANRAQYLQDKADWQSKYETPLQAKELTDNAARRNQQIELAQQLFDFQTTNLTTLNDSTAIRKLQDQTAVFNHWSSVGDQNSQLLQQTAVKSAALEMNLAQADYQYFVSMNGEDAAQRSSYVVAFGGIISSTAGTQIAFLEAERTLKQTLDNNLQVADDSYQTALDTADAAHVLRMQAAQSVYEAAVKQARDEMNDSLQDLFDQYNLSISPLEAAKEAALQAAKTAYTQAVAQAEDNYAYGIDDRSSTGSLNLYDDTQYLADVVFAQQAYAAALAAADQAYADAVGPARAALTAAVQNAYHQFDATTAVLAQNLQAALITAANDYSEELKDALADFNDTNHGLQAAYTSGVVTEQLNHANRLHSANEVFDTALREYKSDLDQAISAANDQWKVTVRNANIQYDTAVYAAELSLRGDLHDNLTDFDDSITTKLTNRADQGFQADSNLQAERRQQRATRDTAMLAAWETYQETIESEREQQIEAIYGKPAQGQQAAVEGALQKLFADLAKNGVEYSEAQIAAENTKRVNEAQEVLFLSGKSWEANVALIEAEKVYAKNGNELQFNAARVVYRDALILAQQEFFLTKMKAVQVNFTNALMAKASDKAKNDAEARNDNQKKMQEISATYSQNVATASLAFDTAAIAASLVETKSNIDSAAANTIANSLYETLYMKGVATAEKSLADENATRRKQYATTEAAKARTLAETLGTARHDAEIGIATALADFKIQQLTAGSIIAQAGQDSLVTLTNNLNTRSLDLQADSQEAALDFEDRLKVAIDDRAATERAAQVDFNTGLKAAYQVATQAAIAAQVDFANSEVAATAAWMDAHELAWQQFRNDVATAQVDGVDRWATTEGTSWAGLVAEKVAAYRDWIAEAGEIQTAYQQGVAELSQELVLDQIAADAARRLTIGQARLDRFDSEDASAALLEEDRETAFVSLRMEQRDLQTLFNDDLNDAVADQNADLLGASSDFQQRGLDAANIRTAADILQTNMLAATRAGEYQAFSFALGLLGEVISQLNATSDKTLQTTLAENARQHANIMADAGHQFSQDAWGNWKEYAKGLADLGAEFTTAAKEWLNAYQTGREAREMVTIDEIRQAMIDHAKALIDAEKDYTLAKLDQNDSPLQKAFKESRDRLNQIPIDQIRPQRPATDFERVKNFANGFLDGLTGGITKDLRHWAGGYWAYSVDENSGYYQVGNAVGMVTLIFASMGSGGAMCGLNVVFRALTFGADAYSAAKGAYNIATGKGTVWDALALLPLASFGVGWLGKQAGVWGCFEANTLVDIPALAESELLAVTATTSSDGRWLLIPGALALLYLRHRLRRRREPEDSQLIDKRYAAWWLRAEFEANKNQDRFNFSNWRFGQTLTWA